MISFSKYHGCGNSFVIILESEIEKYLSISDLTYLSKLRENNLRNTGNFSKLLAQSICNQDLGIGADGFIIVKENPLEMLFFNKDGSLAPMCGNGIRCFSHFCYDARISTHTNLTIKTGAGTLVVEPTNKSPFRLKVNMGKADFSPSRCGIYGTKPFLNQTIDNIKLSSFFMGTVHTIIWVEDFENFEILGEKISNHEVFREKTNVNFAKIIDSNHVEVKTYERGVGVTAACGTGACSVAVLGWLENKFTHTTVKVSLPYGHLYISKDGEKNIFMEGPSTFVCKGEFDPCSIFIS